MNTQPIQLTDDAIVLVPSRLERKNPTCKRCRREYKPGAVCENCPLFPRSPRSAS
jgi:hypothetical protein